MPEITEMACIAMVEAYREHFRSMLKFNTAAYVRLYRNQMLHAPTKQQHPKKRRPFCEIIRATKLVQRILYVHGGSTEKERVQ